MVGFEKTIPSRKSHISLFTQDSECQQEKLIYCFLEIHQLLETGVNYLISLSSLDYCSLYITRGLEEQYALNSYCESGK